MGYPLPIQRRRRRRRRVVLLVGLMLAVVLAALVVRFISERSMLTDYLDAAREAASTYEALGVRADALIAGLETADRSSLLDVLDATATEARNAAAAYQDSEVPTEAGTQDGFLSVAIEAWRSGLVGFDSAVREVLDDPSDPVGVQDLKAAFLDFQVGDRAYAHFLEVIPDLDDNVEVRPYPQVQFIPLELEGRFDATLISERLQALEVLTPHHDVAISEVFFDPAPTGEREGQIEIPFSASLDLSVSIVNRGNEPEFALPVRMRLIEGTNLVVDERSDLITGLEPGEAVAITFADLIVQPGEFYEAVLTVDLDIDDDPTSNRLTQVFFRNDSA